MSENITALRRLTIALKPGILRNLFWRRNSQPAVVQTGRGLPRLHSTRQIEAAQQLPARVPIPFDDDRIGQNVNCQMRGIKTRHGGNDLDSFVVLDHLGQRSEFRRFWLAIHIFTGAFRSPPINRLLVPTHAPALSQKAQMRLLKSAN